MGWLYLGGRTIQEVGGEMMMGLSIYGVTVMDGSLYSRFYGIYIYIYIILYNILKWYIAVALGPWGSCPEDRAEP